MTYVPGMVTLKQMKKRSILSVSKFLLFCPRRESKMIRQGGEKKERLYCLAAAAAAIIILQPGVAIELNSNQLRGDANGGST